MDKIKVIGYAIVFVGLILVGYTAYELYFKKPDTAIPQVQVPQDQCQMETKIFKANDEVMAGLINNGYEFKTTMNYYKCNPIKRGDIALYRFSSARDPVPRIVRAIPGDTFKLVKDTKRNAWNLEVNGKLVMHKDEPYFFGSEAAPTLGLYEKSSHGLLDSDTAIVLSNVPPGGSDSGIFGAISIQDLIGKVDVESAGVATGAAEEVKNEVAPTPTQTKNEPVATPAETKEAPEAMVPEKKPVAETKKTVSAPKPTGPKKKKEAKK